MLDLMLAAEEAASHGDPAVPPIVVGAIALGFLLLLLFITLMYGLGREHT